METETYQILDASQLAERLNLPVSWIREQCRGRADDPLPCLRLGRYVRFEWQSPALDAWISRRRKGSVQ
jgi:hypothetical protein